MCLVLLLFHWTGLGLSHTVAAQRVVRGRSVELRSVRV